MKDYKAMNKALAVIHAMERAGERVQRKVVALRAGVSNGSADSAMAAWRVEKRSQAVSAKIEDLILTGSAKAKYDAVVKATMKQMNAAFEARVMAECAKRADEMMIPEYLRQVRHVEDALNWSGSAVMTKAEYSALLRCVHPDTAGHMSAEDRRIALDTLIRHKLKLTDDPEVRRGVLIDLPRTREELMARRKRA